MSYHPDTPTPGLAAVLAVSNVASAKIVSVTNPTNPQDAATKAYVDASVPAVPVTSVFGRTGAVTALGGDYGVAQVTGAAPLASPALTGTPTAPTPGGGDNSTKVATTAFVQAALPAVPVTSVFGRTGAVVAAGGDYGVAQVTGAAPLASPALTGIPTGPTAAGGTNTTQLATTAFVATSFAPLASPALTGSPTAPTQAALDNSTKLATTAYVDAAVATLAATLGLQLKVATLTLTDAQIKSLPTAAVDIIAAPGAGVMIQPLVMVCVVDATAGVYTNISGTATFQFIYKTSATSCGTVFQNAAAANINTLLATAGQPTISIHSMRSANNSTTAFVTLATVNTDKTHVLNQAVSLTLVNAALGNLTGGNAGNSMKITIYYLQFSP